MAEAKMSHLTRTIDQRLSSQTTAVTFLEHIRDVTNDCVRLFNTDHMGNGTRQFCISRLETIVRNIIRSTPSIIATDTSERLLSSIRAMLDKLRETQTNHSGESGYRAPRCVTGRRGASRYHISAEQLRFLLGCGFTGADIAKMLHVSKKTVKRRLWEYGIKIRELFSDISDDDLDTEVLNLIRRNQRIGPNAVRARLISKGLKVQRFRVREAMLRVDPEGSAIRSTTSLRRRTYSVLGPNSLWHIDGYHKLIRWRIVIHGAIDGFSRVILFLEASDNNRKGTVANHFMAAMREFGVPSRIRVDHGGENNTICSIMEEVRGSDRGSAIRGRSVHNQRIERSWVDLWNGVCNLYYDLFHFLESRGSLDIENNIHLWTLHYVFLPRIKRDLLRYVTQWNNHGLRTEGHSTPMQLYVQRSLELSMTNLLPASDALSQLDTEWQDQEDGTPAVACPITDEHLCELKRLIDPLDDGCDDLGIEIYMQVIQYIANHRTH